MATQKYTPEQVIEALGETRGLVSLAARKLECDAATVRNYAKRYKAVAEALVEAREATTDTAELALFNAILGQEAWAVCFYLKTQGKTRGYIERAELTGKDGEQLTAPIVYIPKEDDE